MRARLRWILLLVLLLVVSAVLFARARDDAERGNPPSGAPSAPARAPARSGSVAPPAPSTGSVPSPVGAQPPPALVRSAEPVVDEGYPVDLARLRAELPGNLAFAERMLADHGSELPERDRGLLALAVDMHRTRLAELPRAEAEARARTVEQERRRAEWQGRSPP